MEIMHKGMWTGRRVLYLSVDAIRANPDQPRKYFEPEALRELAERLGKSQSAVANKLRLLRLSPACVTLLREGGLSERHARALLRLSDENERLAALRVIIERGCNVAQAEAYIESVLQRAAVTPPRRRPTFIVKDVRLFLNTIRRSMGIMQRAGVDAACEREDTDEEIRLTIRIPRTGAAKTA